MALNLQSSICLPHEKICHISSPEEHLVELYGLYCVSEDLSLVICWELTYTKFHEAASFISFIQSEWLNSDGAVAETEKKIIEAFEVFDHECNKTVDVREIGSIVRSLGCFPTEAELHELLAKVEEEEPTGYINLEKFLPVMTKVLLDRSYQPIPEDVLLHAFEALDENKCGYITKEELVKYLTEEGEPFTQEEMEDMLSTALDPETNTIHYRDYISMMIVDETKIFPFSV
ncbi:LOW QUALITY PROTEIN: dynein regulatory complex protein 8 [Athene cunicularia]|uniref:LOW QUALITY PROTEIN: dynein regulatory complex protein 8 n=1 Tax=Athene cunicularia TaxID=194338 RepID=UPI000EF68616|nr:LOW QUALITY PROTEIN: dynein regulatory complex protein 8 [Athene cunicularia]